MVKLEVPSCFIVILASFWNIANWALKLPYPKIEKTVSQFLTQEEYNCLNEKDCDMQWISPKFDESKLAISCHCTQIRQSI